MGSKGAKASTKGALAAELLLAKLKGINGISSKKMFGGHGIFHDGKMFGIIDSKGYYFLKADGDLKRDLLAKGATQHSKMPYYGIPDQIFEDQQQLEHWVQRSIAQNA